MDSGGRALPFLTSALEGGELLASWSGHFISDGLQSGLGAVEKGKSLALAGNQILAFLQPVHIATTLPSTVPVANLYTYCYCSTVCALIYLFIYLYTPRVVSATCNFSIIVVDDLAPVFSVTYNGSLVGLISPTFWL
jgi:hypothetical protein